MRISKKGFSKKAWSFKKAFFLGIPIVGILFGVYMLINILTPAISIVFVDQKAVELQLSKEKPNSTQDMLYIPSVGIKVPIHETEASIESQLEALEKGAIQRAPDSGNPRDGGNYVVAAHRFDLQILASETLYRSPFYYIDKIKVGDDVFVDYKGIRYKYTITTSKEVKPDDVYIEERTKKPTITLYSCTLAGAKDGRVVLIGELVGE